MKPRHDVAAYVWPAYHDEPRSRLFFPRGMGEWERVVDAQPKFEGHRQPRRPLWGYLNEADPRVMEMKLDVAAEHGVNVLIYDWYWYDRRPFLEQALNEGYLKARNNDRVRFYLMWANHDAATVWDIRTSHDPQVIWRGDVDRPEFERVGRRLIERYFSHPSYYRIEGRPVFAVYDLPNLLKGLGGVEPTARALNWLRKESDGAGTGGLHLQAVLRRGLRAETVGLEGEPQEVQRRVVEQLGFDSTTHYQWCHVSSPGRDYAEWGEEAVRAWQVAADTHEATHFPHVSIGWDNNPRFKELKDTVVTDATPERFEAFLRRAREFVDGRAEEPRLITVNSLNEWAESSYLEPDLQWGYGYLEAVQQVFT